MKNTRRNLSITMPDVASGSLRRQSLFSLLQFTSLCFDYESLYNMVTWFVVVALNPCVKSPYPLCGYQIRRELETRKVIAMGIRARTITNRIARLSII